MAVHLSNHPSPSPFLKKKPWLSHIVQGFLLFLKILFPGLWSIVSFWLHTAITEKVLGCISNISIFMHYFVKLYTYTTVLILYNVCCNIRKKKLYIMNKKQSQYSLPTLQWMILQTLSRSLHKFGELRK